MTEKKLAPLLELLKGIKVTPRLETVSGNQMPGAFWLSIDIGLWRRRPRPHLTAMVYYTKGKEWTPPAGQLAAWEEVLSKIRELWQRYACPKCKGVGGDCSECGDTGWVRFLEWTEKGRNLTVDNYPVL